MINSTTELIDNSILQLMELEDTVKSKKDKLLISSFIFALLWSLYKKHYDNAKKLEENFISTNLLNSGISRNNKKIFEEAKEGLDNLKEALLDPIKCVIAKEIIKRNIISLENKYDFLKSEHESHHHERQYAKEKVS